MTARAPWPWQRLWSALQPIVDLHDGRVVGHEALLRGPVGTPWQSPAALFAAADADQALAEALERRCRAMAMERARSLPPDQMLFVNVDSRFAPLPLHAGLLPLDAARVAIEVNEGHPLLDNEPFLRRVAAWRAEGHPIVIDDYGAGYAAAATVLALGPDIIKLDRALVAGIDRDARRQVIVRSIREYTADMGIRLVAEGVETGGELAAVRQLGVDLAQGYLLGRPGWKVRSEPIDLVALGGHAVAAVTAPGPVRSGDATLAFYAAAAVRAEVPTYVVDRHRRVVAWNDAAAALTGHPAEERLGRRCFEGGLAHQDAQGRSLCFTDCPLVRSMAQGSPVAAQVSFSTAQGERLWVQAASTPLWDSASGRVVGACEQFVPAVAKTPAAAWSARALSRG